MLFRKPFNLSAHFKVGTFGKNCPSPKGKIFFSLLGIETINFNATTQHCLDEPCLFSW